MGKDILAAVCVMLMSSGWIAQGFSVFDFAGEPRNGGCGDGMTLIGQFFNCTKPLMEPYRVDSDWLRPGYSLNQGILNYMQTYCSMILPRGVHCLESKVTGCDAKTKALVLRDARGAGGFCAGGSVSDDIRRLLTSLPSASPRSVESCPVVDTTSCYDKISEQLYTQEVFYLPAPELAPYVQRTFESVFLCLVDKYRTDRARCKDWQLNFLWRHARTFVPNPLGFTLRPALLLPLAPGVYKRRSNNIVWV